MRVHAGTAAVDVQDDAAAISRCDGIEHRRLPLCGGEALHPVGMLVQQKAQIRRGR